MRPTSATIRLGDIASNYQLACRIAPASRAIAVIKANAYGHGIQEVAKHLQPMVPAFAVAFIDEAVQLRDAGIRKPILVLQGVSRATDIAEIAARGLWLSVHHQQQLDWLKSAKVPAPIRVWLKVDTGMNRLGFAPDALEKTYQNLYAMPNVQPGTVVFTHLACADELENPLTRQQVRVARSFSEKHELELSIANSAGVLHWPESHARWNRPGYMLYGLCPRGSFGGDSHGLLPAMSMNSEIISIRNLAVGDGVGYGHDWVAKRRSRIGTVAIGYGDGYPRHAPSGTPVLVNGQRAALVGRVSMDAISVDLTDLEGVNVGGPVELWGQGLSVNEVASSAGTIGYEILAGLTGRVPLRYQS